MKEYILIRHGETDFNKEERFMGHSDCGLNERGREQARSLGLKLKDDGIDVIYASDLLRCRETVEAMNIDAPVNYSENLREMNFGLWEGLTYGEIRKSYGDEIKIWLEDWVERRAPGGESFSEMTERLLKEFEEIRNKESGKTALVTHGGCVRALLSHFLMGETKESWRFYVDNAAAARLCFNRDFAFIKTLNEK